MFSEKIYNKIEKESENDQVNDLLESPWACIHRPTAFDLHQHNIQWDSQDGDDVRGSTSTLPLGTLCSLAIHFCLIVSLPQSELFNISPTH